MRDAEQGGEQVRTRSVWRAGAAGVAITALIVAVAWWRVVPPAAAVRPPDASPIERGLIEQASGGDDARRAGLRRLERTEWIDRAAGVVRIPIDRAIDAVVADPALIGAPVVDRDDAAEAGR